MRKFVKPTILLFFIMTSTFIGFAETGIDYSQVREDVEVMAKVIDKAIQKEFPDEARIGSPFFSRGFGGCQGVYLKGYGAIFMTSIGFPVAEKKEIKEEKTSDDLWQEAKSELAGGGAPRYGSSFSGYSGEKVERLKGKLLEAMGTYGSNIRQLGSQENIVVAVQGTSSPDVPFMYTTGASLEPIKVHVKEMPELSAVPEPSDVFVAPVPVEPVVPSSNAAPAQKDLKLVMKADEMRIKADAMKQVEVEIKEAQRDFEKQQKALASSGDAYLSLIGTPDVSSRGRTTLVIKASKDSIIAYKNKRIDLDEFLNQAEITQY